MAQFFYALDGITELGFWIELVGPVLVLLKKAVEISRL
jgi:hypothetical protein